MTRLRLLATTVLPSMLVGGLMFHSALGQPAPPAPPVPAAPAAPAAPAPPPPPPAPPRAHDVRVVVDGHELNLDDIRRQVDSQLAQARDQIEHANLPPRMRSKLSHRLDRLRGKLDSRLSHIDTSDLSHMSEQLAQLGEDIASSMDGVGGDMEVWGKALGAQISQDVQHQIQQQMQHQMHVQVGGGGDNRFHWDNDNDGDHDSDADDNDHDNDDHDAATPPTPPSRAAADRLGDLSLQPGQREQLARIRSESHQRVAAARAELARRSAALRAELDDPRVDRARVERDIDAVAAAEGELRKAKILGWLDARAVLDDGQRKRVEDAAGGH